MRLLLLLSLFSVAAQAQVIDIDINGRPYSCTPRNGGGNPIECVEVAYAGPFTREESLRLCARARNDGPARCALKAYAGPFTRDESLRLCTSPYATVGTAECALRAYAGPYTREEALNMCRGTNKSLELLSKEESERLLIEVNEKAMREGTYKR